MWKIFNIPIAISLLKKYGITVFFIFLCLYSLGFAVFVEKITSTPYIVSESSKTAIVVTGGEGRVKAGLNLLASEEVSQLFISGVHKSVDVKKILNVLKLHPKKSDCCIKLGYDAQTTFSNAIEIKDFVIKNNISDFYLISNDFHMPRALWEIEFRTRSIQPKTKIIPYPIKNYRFNAENTYSDYSTFMLMAGEYIKYSIVIARITVLNLFL